MITNRVTIIWEESKAIKVAEEAYANKEILKFITPLTILDRGYENLMSQSDVAPVREVEENICELHARRNVYSKILN